jgi:PEP-CTERM motif
LRPLGPGGNSRAAADQVTGPLAVATATTANSRFTISPDTLTPANAAGPAAHFDPLLSYDWSIAQASGGITGLTPRSSRWIQPVRQPDQRRHVRPGAVPGQLNLSITFTPVPEPGTLALVGLAAGGWWRARRRRRRIPTGRRAA